MERHFGDAPARSGGTDATTDEARLLLDALAADRTTLARRAAAPRWFYPVLGVLAAAYVASAALDADTGRRSVVWLVLVAAVVALVARQRGSGVRLASTGAAGLVLALAVLVPVLLLLSVALGLAASVSAWWVLVPAAAAVPVVVGVGRRFERVQQGRIRDVGAPRAG